LQCVAVCCSVLQCVAVCCSVLQCAAVCCSVLQCVGCCSVLDHIYLSFQLISILQSGAVRCSVLQRMLQCIAVCCSVLYHIYLSFQLHCYIQRRHTHGQKISSIHSNFFCTRFHTQKLADFFVTKNMLVVPVR